MGLLIGAAVISFVINVALSITSGLIQSVAEEVAGQNSLSVVLIAAR